jgi:hypothetical protein
MRQVLEGAEKGKDFQRVKVFGLDLDGSVVVGPGVFELMS